MRGRTAIRAAGAIALSFCVHVFVGLVSPARPPAPRSIERPTLSEFSIVRIRPEPPAVPKVAVPAQPSPPPVKRRARKALVVPRASIEAAQLPAAEPQPSVVKAPAPASPAPAPDLSPSQVAKSCQADSTWDVAEPEVRRERTPEDAQAEFDRRLFASANDISHARRREPPKLRRHADGTLWYQGKAFFAVVMPDGTVKFSDIIFADPPPPDTSDYPAGLAPEYRELVKRVQPFVNMKLPFPDLNDMIARIADDDPYAEEKRWFLRATADLRTPLIDAARAEESRGVERRVIGELRGIVGNPALSADQKRTAVFAVWERCAGDGEEQWQRVVESFIRERMPRDGEYGFSPELLARLNAERVGARAFAPYED